jgi:glutathione S-transferase
LDIIEDTEETGKDVVATISQSAAILRYLGKRGGLYPTSDDVMALKIDSILDFVEDGSRLIQMSVMGAEKSLIQDKPWTEEEKQAIRKRIAEDEQNGLPFYFDTLEQNLKDNGTGFLVGDRLTIADMQYHRLVSVIQSGMLDGIPTTLLDKYPLSTGLYRTIEDIPEVKAFRASHPVPYETFDYVPTAN